MLLNKLNNMRLLQADGGDGGNGANGGNADVIEPNPKADDNEPKKSFTQEELNDIVSKRLAKEAKKHNEELEALRKEYESNINSKVEDKLSEAEKLAKMSASEKKEYELNKRLQELEAKEKEYSIKELKNTSRELLGELGYSKEEVKALEGFINFENADTVKKSIDSLHKTIDKLVTDKVNTKVAERLKTKNIPEKGEQNKGQAKTDALRKAFGLK